MLRNVFLILILIFYETFENANAKKRQSAKLLYYLHFEIYKEYCIILKFCIKILIKIFNTISSNC